MSATRLYPGMCDGSLEIFFHPEEQQLKAIEGGTVKPFTAVTESRKLFLYNILQDEPATAAALERMVPNDPKGQVEKLAKCRFGGLNFQPDFCPDTEAQSYDFVECDQRGTCPGCGIVCRNLEYHGEQLDSVDVKAIRLMATDHKTVLLAEELGMPEGTFHVYRTKLYRRIGVKSKPELARVGVELGLI